MTVRDQHRSCHPKKSLIRKFDSPIPPENRKLSRVRSFVYAENFLGIFIFVLVLHFLIQCSTGYRNYGFS